MWLQEEQAPDNDHQVRAKDPWARTGKLSHPISPTAQVSPQTRSLGRKLRDCVGSVAKASLS